MTAELEPAQQRIEHRSEALGYARKRVGQKAGNSRKEEEEEGNREEEAEERREGWGLCMCHRRQGSWAEGGPSYSIWDNLSTKITKHSNEYKSYLWEPIRLYQ